MGGIVKAFPLLPTLSPDIQTQLTKKRQYVEISGQFKEVRMVLEACPAMFEKVKSSIDQIIIEGKGLKGVKDPPPLKAKGRPKASRIAYLSTSVSTRLTNYTNWEL